jgi:hypothetical protein
MYVVSTPRVLEIVKRSESLLVTVNPLVWRSEQANSLNRAKSGEAQVFMQQLHFPKSYLFQ